MITHPFLSGKPVIIDHLGYGSITVCTGEPFRMPSEDEYPEVPRVMCSLCQVEWDRAVDEGRAEG